MAATTPAPTGTSTGGTYTGSTPGQDQYNIYAAQRTQAYNNALQQIQDQRNQYLQASGLQGVFDANGNMTDFSVQANDPSGSYQQMMVGNAQQGASDDAAMHALGFGGGLAQQMQDSAQQGYAANAANWGAGVNAQIAGLGQQQQAATDSYNQDLATELLNNIQAGISTQAFNPFDPGSGNTSVTDPGTATPPFTPPTKGNTLTDAVLQQRISALRHRANQTGAQRTANQALVQKYLRMKKNN